MVSQLTFLIGGMLLTLVGLFWALPWGENRRRAPGWVLVASGLVMMACLLPPFGSFLARTLLWGMTFVTVASAVGMVTATRPLYSALWFGMTVLGTAGLLLYNGAEFVSMALIVVYIGAILVVFLFLIMLDEPLGQAAFNRQSWEPFVASLVGVILIGLVTAACLKGMQMDASTGAFVAGTGAGEASVHGQNLGSAPLVPTRTGELGEELFGSFAFAVEGLGLLLMLALIGATVIIARPLEPLIDLVSWQESEPPSLVEWLP